MIQDMATIGKEYAADANSRRLITEVKRLQDPKTAGMNKLKYVAKQLAPSDCRMSNIKSYWSNRSFVRRAS